VPKLVGLSASLAIRLTYYYTVVLIVSLVTLVTLVDVKLTRICLCD